MYKILFAVSLGFIIIIFLVIGMHDSYARGKTNKYKSELEKELHSFRADSDHLVALRAILFGLQTDGQWLALGPLRTIAAGADLCSKVDKAIADELKQRDTETVDVLDRIATELQCEYE